MSAIYLSDRKLIGAYWGKTPIKSIYIGNHLFFTTDTNLVAHVKSKRVSSLFTYFETVNGKAGIEGQSINPKPFKVSFSIDKTTRQNRNVKPMKVEKGSYYYGRIKLSYKTADLVGFKSGQYKRARIKFFLDGKEYETELTINFNSIPDVNEFHVTYYEAKLPKFKQAATDLVKAISDKWNKGERDISVEMESEFLFSKLWEGGGGKPQRDKKGTVEFTFTVPWKGADRRKFFESPHYKTGPFRFVKFTWFNTFGTNHSPYLYIYGDESSIKSTHSDFLSGDLYFVITTTDGAFYIDKESGFLSKVVAMKNKANGDYLLQLQHSSVNPIDVEWSALGGSPSGNLSFEIIRKKP